MSRLSQDWYRDTVVIEGKSTAALRGKVVAELSRRKENSCVGGCSELPSSVGDEWRHSRGALWDAERAARIESGACFTVASVHLGAGAESQSHSLEVAIHFTPACALSVNVPVNKKKKNPLPAPTQALRRRRSITDWQSKTPSPPLIQKGRRGTLNAAGGGSKKWQLMVSAAGLRAEQSRPTSKTIIKNKKVKQVCDEVRETHFFQGGNKTFAAGVRHVLKSAASWEMNFRFGGEILQHTPGRKREERKFRGANCCRVYDFIKIESFLPPPSSPSAL